MQLYRRQFQRMNFTLFLSLYLSLSIYLSLSFSFSHSSRWCLFTCFSLHVSHKSSQRIDDKRMLSKHILHHSKTDVLIARNFRDLFRIIINPEWDLNLSVCLVKFDELCTLLIVALPLSVCEIFEEKKQTTKNVLFMLPLSPPGVQNCLVFKTACL